MSTLFERLSNPKTLKVLAVLVVVLSLFGAGIGVYTVANYGTLSDRTKIIETAIDGDPGTPGIQGIKGPKGKRGPRGFTVRGPKGDTGDRGPRGFTGERGPRGFRGPKGDRGPRGLLGLEGDPGPVGPLPSGEEVVNLLCQTEVALCSAARALP